MKKIRKILKGLDICSKGDSLICQKECPYYVNGACNQEIYKDTIEAIKCYDAIATYTIYHEYKNLNDKVYGDIMDMALRELGYIIENEDGEKVIRSFLSGENVLKEKVDV